MSVDQIDLELVGEALELLEDAARLLEESGLTDAPAFRAYVACQLQGEERGWLGGPFLIDEVRKVANQEEDG